MDKSESHEHGPVRWRPEAPRRAVGIAPPGQVPFVPDESQMTEGLRAAQEVDAAAAEQNSRNR
jgi:hypothetical protein